MCLYKEITLSVLKTVTRRYLDQPQLITPSAFKDIASLLDMQKGRDALQDYFKPLTEEEKVKAKMEDPFYSGYRFSSDGTEIDSPESYSVVKIEGPLTYKPETAMCAPETCNYQDMVKSVQAIADSGKKRIIMIHDSPGGVAYNSMSMAKEVRKIADENDIELIGYVDGLSASASYIWLSICDKIISNPDASTGSIGVVISLLNNNEALKKAGYKRTFITAGASKVPYDEDGEFKENFIEDLQNSVDELYENFVDHVVTYRKGMSREDVKNTEAKVFRAKEALALGLIDSIMTNAEFKEKYLEGSSSVNPNNNKITHKVEKMSNDTQVAPEANSELATVMAELEELRKFQASTVLQTKKDSISAKLAGAEFLTNKEELVAHLAAASEEESNVFFSTFEQFTAKTSALQAEITQMASEHKEAVTGFESQIETMKADHETFKQEFSQPEAIQGNVDDKELSFEEKKARAVAAAKANQ
ncbi:putative SohB protein [Vibrio phage 249E41-1]|nr:putative SohB protein [Vibrio phage 249E41-1]CAH9015721.1 putative SohB protein [Vibrio phage 193E37-1]